MSYKDLLNDWHRGEIRIYGYITKPEKMETTDDIIYRDKLVQGTINECQAMINNLQEYRIALAKRYAELETMTYTKLLKLERIPHMDYIEYNISIYKTYEDKTTITELHEHFKGNERYAAFKRFAELQKQFPGIPCEKDIERKKWERR